ncbi:FecCD family ABC transporter permease [Parafrankia sp. FMc2]|uniref:FecCD family ABC transporter permease n=1 Tax=Parafrankia sp. FMc2 TaxID=3233196 RepID=UPI0034D58071
MSLAVLIGSVGLRPGDVASVLQNHLLGGSRPVSEVNDYIVWQLRVPRVLLAVVVGAGLALAGAVLQATVRNPLADPYLLGVSAGAGLLAAITITFGAAAVAGLSTSGAAFVGALASTVMVLFLARQEGRFTPTRLILAGVTMSYLLSGLTSFVILRGGDPEAAQSILFWMLGSLASASWSTLLIPTMVVALGGGYLLCHARALNAMVLGDDGALSLGVAIHRLRTRLLIMTSLVTGVLVAVAGGIGFVGLVIPHLVRILFGPDHQRLLPMTMLVGAIYLVVVDVLCRVSIRPEEIPVGVVTSVLGAPVFLWLMRKSGAGR